ncbi:MAG: MarR family transcriptional regulator [Alphaproteobacteria bacterium]
MSDKAGAFDLADYVPYLLNRAGSRIADDFGQVARDEGLSLQMWRVLAVLHHREPRPVGEIAEWATIEVSTLSRILRTMENQRLVHRRRFAGDYRKVLVSRTHEGRAATEKLVPVALAFESLATAGFSAEEVETLKSLLRRLFDNLGDLERMPATRAG